MNSWTLCHFLFCFAILLKFGGQHGICETNPPLLKSEGEDSASAPDGLFGSSCPVGTGYVVDIQAVQMTSTTNPKQRHNAFRWRRCGTWSSASSASAPSAARALWTLRGSRASRCDPGCLGTSAWGQPVGLGSEVLGERSGFV